MPMNWNEAADAKLFAGVLATSEGIKLDYTKLADWMGNECTAKAITHRIAHVKKISKEADTADKPSKTPKTGGTTAKKRKAKDVSDESAEGGDGDESPTKAKAKKPRAKAVPKSKAKAAPKAKVTVLAEAAEDDTEDVIEEKKMAGAEEEVKVEDAGVVREAEV